VVVPPWGPYGQTCTLTWQSACDKTVGKPALGNWRCGTATDWVPGRYLNPSARVGGVGHGGAMYSRANVSLLIAEGTMWVPSRIGRALPRERCRTEKVLSLESRGHAFGLLIALACGKVISSACAVC
jgi:hypothetical protein